MLVFWARAPLFVAAYLCASASSIARRPTDVAAAVGALIWLPVPGPARVF